MEKTLKTRTDWGILILRIFIATRIFYGVIDNVTSWEKMVEFSVFLEGFNFPFPLVSAVTSVYFQLIAAVAILLGLKIRIFSLIMVINFIVAVIFVHVPVNDSFEGMTPALAILFACLTFVFTGASKYSLDYFLLRSNGDLVKESDEKHRNPYLEY